MYVHSRKVGFTIALSHTEEFPTVSLIKAGMVCQQVNRRDSFAPQILNSHIKQPPRNPLTTVILIGIDRAHIGSQVLPVVEVIFNHP